MWIRENVCVRPKDTRTNQPTEKQLSQKMLQVECIFSIIIRLCTNFSRVMVYCILSGVSNQKCWMARNWSTPSYIVCYSVLESYYIISYLILLCDAHFNIHVLNSSCLQFSLVHLKDCMKTTSICYQYNLATHIQLSTTTYFITKIC